MFCNQCGEEVPEDSKFCPFCGASIIKKPKKVPISEPTEKTSLLMIILWTKKLKRNSETLARIQNLLVKILSSWEQIQRITPLQIRK